ncbi:MAG: 50S ribosomal protein L9 [Candidatus Ratteibacteria bacterium]
MKVILTQDVPNLGKAGEVHEVKVGYARNFLFPRQMADIADEVRIRNFEEKKKAQEAKREKFRHEASYLQKKLEKISVTIEAKAGEEEKLFGSVTTDGIAEALKNQHEIEIDRHQIVLEEPIKKLGFYKVAVHLLEEIKAELKVWVVQG